MATIYKNTKKCLYRMCIKIAAPAIARQLHRGMLGQPATALELSKYVQSIRESGKIWPIIKRLLPTRVEEDTKNYNPPSVRAAENTTTAQYADDAPISPVAATVLPKTTNPPSHQRGRLIVVSSNCQTGGLTAALQACLENDTLIPLPLPSTEEGANIEEFISKLEHADVWISLREIEWANAYGFRERPGLQFMRVPSIDFRAFHPDLCYARNKQDGRFTIDNYNSAIAAWAYNHGMQASDAAKLFTRDIYAQLGYFHIWEHSLKELRTSFNASGLDFSRYMLAVKRTGLFMHSVNHPTVHALSELAKSLAVKLGAPDTLYQRDLKLSDSLISGAVWPLYPEIADHYSLSGGCYDWKLRGTWLRGLDSYLDHAFREYESQQIPHGGLEILNRDEAFFTQVLGPQAGISQ